VRILVTGGSGYVGRTVVERLVRRHEVRVFDRVAPQRDDVEFAEGSILSSADCARACAGCEGVVHLAAIPAPGRNSDDELMEVNVMGTQRVVAAAAEVGVRRVVAASSDSTLGFVFGEGQIVPEYLPADEAHPLRPRDAYGLSKLLGEEILRRYTRLTGLETVALRYCWVWNDDLYRNIHEFADHPERFVGQLWGYVDVRDVAQAVERALVADGIKHETLFISARRTFIPIPTVELVRRFLPPAVEVRDPGYFEAEPYGCCHRYDRARRVIGYEPEFDWEARARELGAL